MKKSVLLTGMIAFTLFGFTTHNLQAAAGNTNALLITLQLSGVFQHTAVATNNNVETTTLTATPIKIGNANILSLLQAEFSTTFPTGAQLAYNLTGKTGFVVLDQNGNQILDATTNLLDPSYGFGLSNSVVAGAISPQLFIGTAVNNLVTSNLTEVVTALSPDYGIFYFDSHGNNFHIDGLLTLKINATQVGSSLHYNTVSFTITGSGGGNVFNPADGHYDAAVFNKVKVSAKGAGIIQ